MKIVDAVWEKRNMGVSAVECAVGEGESPALVRQALAGIPPSVEYAVVKVPVGRLELYSLLGELGFSFAETLLHVSRDTEVLRYPSPMLKRLTESVGYAPTGDLVHIRASIRRGMFTTDRVALDGRFSPGQAAERYCGWLGDELDRGSLLFDFLYKGEPVGFMCARPVEKGVFYSVLGGLFPSEKPLPLGSALFMRQLDIARDLGATRFETTISSNNRPVVKAYSQCEYQITDMEYVFIRHGNGEGKADAEG